MSIGSIGQSVWAAANSALGSPLTDSISFTPAATSATSGSPTTGSPVPATGGGTDPFKQLATDLQAALVQLQSGENPGQPASTLASTNPAASAGTAPTSAAAHHHHHHHGGSGGQGEAGTDPFSSLTADLGQLRQDLARAQKAYGGAASSA